MEDVKKSYKKIRQTIGALGIGLPLLIYVHTGIVWDCWSLQDSISHYYFTSGNVFFEGILWILGLVLIYYPAYKNEKKRDVWLTTFSGFFAWGVALIPTNSNSADSCAMFHLTDSPLRNAIHLSCAGLMLGIFSYMSIFLFTRSNPANYNAQNPGTWKKVRNFIYVFCGLLTFLSIVTILVLQQFEKKDQFPFGHKYTFWFEVTAIVPFGISWLIKGGFLFTDEGDPSTMAQLKSLVTKGKLIKTN